MSIERLQLISSTYRDKSLVSGLFYLYSPRFSPILSFYFLKYVFRNSEEVFVVVSFISPGAPTFNNEVRKSCKYEEDLGTL